MKERPILFSAAMVRAILDGRKTQTRRVVRGAASEWLQPGMFTPEFVSKPENGLSPFGCTGDHLWVRETWAEFIDTDTIDGQTHELGRDTLYRADGENHRRCTPWRPSIHMPRAASRITLEVTGVRVERLQEISEADAIAEGVEPLDFERYEHDRSICPRCGGTRLHDALGPNGGVLCDVDCRECDTHVKRYRHLWDSLNAARGYGWDTSPWVWVIEFRRVK